MDAYEIYSQWWKDHYGYEFPVDRETWKRWCQAPCSNQSKPDFDTVEEIRDGWSLDHRDV